MRNATHLTVATFGALAGLVGIEHGTGEILQGSVAPVGLVILSWPDAPFFESLAGEPAMTLLPNLLLAGVLSCLFSLAYLITAVRFSHRRNAPAALLVLAAIMLVVGAGFGPPVLGGIVALAATRIRRPLNAKRIRLPGSLQTLLAQLWPWTYGAALLTWLLLFPGLGLLAYFLGFDNPAVTTTVIILSFVLLLLAFAFGFVHDMEPRFRYRRGAIA